MSRRRKQLEAAPFDTIRLEGSLFVPELLERAARGEAASQKEADYNIPRGLKLHDEYGRAFRIAIASWQAFAAQIARADLDPAGTTQSFVLGLLRECLGYTDLTPLGIPITLGDRGFPVTAQALGGRLPVIIAPHNLGLDDPDPRFAIQGSGTRKKSAHQLAQEFLNAAPHAIWAIVTNGKVLRLLRDADTLTRPNFLEFDLETILRDGEGRYADFAALWRILHASRSGTCQVPSSSLDSHGELPAARPAPADCIWEKWKTEGHAQGLRVRDGLRDGVQEAILILANGFLTHPDNTDLRQRLHDGTLTLDDYFQQFFRLIYRCLFLFCTEERDLLHPPDELHPSSLIPHPSSAAARKAYAEGYSLRRLRNRSLRQSAHDSHGDLWQSIRIVFKSLATGQSRLALPALGGLFAETQCPDLDGASLTNRVLLSAMRELRWFFDKRTGKRSAIDYRNMGTQELGSVYESLLELVPTLDLPARCFGFAGITDAGSTSGNARKTTGSYYTADPLVMELINSALEPVIRQRLADAREIAALPWSTVAARIKDDRVQCFYVLAYLVKHAAVPADASPETFGRAWNTLPAATRANPLCAEALLSITVCDPSCGSGHFLLAAARRLAEKLAELRAPDGAVRPNDYRHALREVASRCLYGVDINPMAVELCRVALWLETVDPGKPLGFLNHHIRTGNSLLGTTPDLIAAGLPDDTFTAIEGDDKPACAELKKRNKKEREGFGPLFEKEEQTIRDRLRLAATQIEAMDDSQPDTLQKKEAAFTTNETAPEYRHAKLLADLWCAAFVIKKHFTGNDDTPVVSSPSPSPNSDLPSAIEGQLLHTQDELFGQSTPTPEPKAASKKQPRTKNQEQGTPSGITTAHLRDLVQAKPLPADLQAEVEALARQYRFFHWHLAFPQVFDQGGFDCMLGNPPWERINLKEREWFAERAPEIGNTTNKATRSRLIQSLKQTSPSIYAEFHAALRGAEAESHYIRNSSSFPLCGRGDVNLYAVFAELMRLRLNSGGRFGAVLPTGIAIDDTTKFFFQDVVDRGSLVSLFDFENRSGLFPAVDSRMKFCLFTAGSGLQRLTDAADFVFFAQSAEELMDKDRRFRMGAKDIAVLNPNTRTTPIFRSPSEAILSLAISKRISPLTLQPETRDDHWGFAFREVIHMAHDAHLFQTRLGGQGSQGRELDLAPLYEAKMVHHFDHRWMSFSERDNTDEIEVDHQNPDAVVWPRYWISRELLKQRIRGDWSRRWQIGWRLISNTTNERTAIFAVVPEVGMSNSLPMALVASPHAWVLPALMSAFFTDFGIRQRLGGTNVSMTQSSHGGINFE